MFTQSIPVCVVPIKVMAWLFCWPHLGKCWPAPWHLSSVPPQHQWRRCWDCIRLLVHAYYLGNALHLFMLHFCSKSYVGWISVQRCLLLPTGYMSGSSERQFLHLLAEWASEPLNAFFSWCAILIPLSFFLYIFSYFISGYPGTPINILNF